ncbi:hypothetical protein ABKN59_007833 [Abortiporus biennis]
MSTIPYELLFHIALKAADEVYPSHSWIRLSQVCRHWRDCILQAPSRWSDIHEDSLDAIDRARVFAERSQNIHLRISFREYDRSIGTLLEWSTLIKENANRIVSLKIRLPSRMRSLPLSHSLKHSFLVTQKMLSTFPN